MNKQTRNKGISVILSAFLWLDVTTPSLQDTLLCHFDSLSFIGFLAPLIKYTWEESQNLKPAASLVIHVLIIVAAVDIVAYGY